MEVPETGLSDRHAMSFSFCVFLSFFKFITLYFKMCLFFLNKNMLFTIKKKNPRNGPYVDLVVSHMLRPVYPCVLPG